MLQVFALVECLAHGAGPVLVMGERGAGTTTVADALHALGPRADRPLVHLDCATTPAAQLAAELLGVEGLGEAGAGTATTGVLEFAAGGTVVLQEVGHLSLELQATVLRVLQTKVLLAASGRARPERSTLRLIATTSRDLELMSFEGTFRRDLQVPCSPRPRWRCRRCARRREVPLPRAVVRRGGGAGLGAPGPDLEPGVESALRRHAWPGNPSTAAVRRRGRRWRSARGTRIQVAHLPAEIAGAWSSADDGSGWDAREFAETSVVTLTPTATTPRPGPPEPPHEPAPLAPSPAPLAPPPAPSDGIAPCRPTAPTTSPWRSCSASWSSGRWTRPEGRSPRRPRCSAWTSGG